MDPHSENKAIGIKDRKKEKNTETNIEKNAKKNAKKNNNKTARRQALLISTILIMMVQSITNKMRCNKVIRNVQVAVASKFFRTAVSSFLQMVLCSSLRKQKVLISVLLHLLLLITAATATTTLTMMTTTNIPGQTYPLKTETESSSRKNTKVP